MNVDNWNVTVWRLQPGVATGNYHSSLPRVSIVIRISSLCFHVLTCFADQNTLVLTATIQF